jgi:hypothetical protein
MRETTEGAHKTRKNAISPCGWQPSMYNEIRPRSTAFFQILTPKKWYKDDFLEMQTNLLILNKLTASPATAKASPAAGPSLI